MRPLHIGDDILGHPNGVISILFMLPNLVSNHLDIGLLLDHIGGATAFVPPVGLGLDERTLDSELFFGYSHPKASSLVEDTCWTCVLLCGTLSKSRWTSSQASSPCHHGYLEKVGHCSICSCLLV